MSERVKIVSSVRSSDDTTFTIAFSSGDVLGFTKDEVLEYGLYIEDKFVDDFNKLCSIILAKRMMAFAASYVLFSMKSVYQVRVKLEEYCNKSELEEGWMPFYNDAVDEAIRRLEELNYINDEQYVRRYVKTTLKGKIVSKNNILNELVYKKGIDKNLAECIVEEIYANEEFDAESENAYRLLKKKTGGKFPCGDEAEAKKEIAKLYRFALSKGFSYSVTECAIQRIKEENNT
jgi:SOS response regulatory protein OraA/RecX